MAVQYLLRAPARALTIDILDGHGAVIRSFVGGGAAGAATPAGGAQGSGTAGGGAQAAAGAPVTAGLHAVTWDLRYPGATSFPGMILWGGSVAGPFAPPGRYRVRMTADGREQSQPLVVRRHPLFSATDADLEAQFELATKIRDTLSEANNAVIRIRELKAQVAERLEKSGDSRLTAAGEALRKSLAPVEEAIYQVRNQSGQDPLNFPIRINNRLASLLSSVNRGDGAPLGEVPAIFEDLVKQLAVQTARLRALEAKDLGAFNAEASRLGLPAVR